MKRIAWNQVFGYALFALGFLILYIDLFVLREADKRYGIAAGIIFLVGLRVMFGKSATD
jgi:hypothetical protein